MPITPRIQLKNQTNITNNMTFTALITPFLEDFQVDWNSLTNIIIKQFDSNTDGIVLMGTTGEAPTLTTGEQDKILELAHQIRLEKNSSKQIWFGIGDNSTDRVVNSMLKYNNENIDGYLISAPAYNKPPQAGLIKHFLECDKNSKKPIMLYNVPSRTGVNISPETIVEIVKNSNNVRFLKEANSNIDHIIELFALSKKEELKSKFNFKILSGNDDLMTVFHNLGGDGVVSVLSNIYPNETTEIEAGNLELFFEFLPTIKQCFVTSNPIPIKNMMKNLEMITTDQVRLPLVRSN